MRAITPCAAVLILVLAAPFMLHAQDVSSSIRRQQHAYYSHLGVDREEAWDSINGRPHDDGIHDGPLAQPRAACRLGANIVYGWHPYWQGTSYKDYDYSLLSDICYFSYDVDASTGSYTSIHNWATTDLVPTAKAAGVRVHLCVVLFSNHAALLASPANRGRLIDSLIALVKLRGADGVNIDFEAVPAAQRGNLATFMTELGTRFHHDVPGSQISIALPAVDWSNVFDVAAMEPAVDLFIIMGYDFHWSGSDDAGPVAPKNGGTRWGSYDVTRSVNYYRAHGIPSRKLVLGVPYYGYEWATADSAAGAATRGDGTAVVYASATVHAAQYGRRWDQQSSTPYYAYKPDTSWRQCWYDDATSLRMKYEMVAMKQLAGIGIWALGYDGTSRDLWDAIEGVFTDCAAAPCSGFFTDMGGPAGNYYDGDDFTFTIAPAGARSVTLAFNSFNVADDRLAIFDGRDTNAPRIGQYSGTSSPGIVQAGGAMTIRFTSNGAGASWGWTATWTCSDGPMAVDRGAGAAFARASVAPNPVRNVAAIGYTLAAEVPVRIVLTDLMGAEVLGIERGLEQRGAHVCTVDLSSLPAGIYFARVHGGATTASAAVVKE